MGVHSASFKTQTTFFKLAQPHGFENKFSGDLLSHPRMRFVSLFFTALNTLSFTYCFKYLFSLQRVLTPDAKRRCI